MEREEQYLLHLLGAYLRNDSPDIWPEADWKRLTDLTRIHNLTSTLGYMSMSWPICPDPALKSRLRGWCLAAISGNAKRMALAEEFSRGLAEAGIDHILMKGYILRELFPVPELRTFGDIDIVIRQSDRERCHEQMLLWGFQVKTDWEPVYSYIRGSELYEIHTQIVEVDVSETADCREYFRDPWAHAVPLGEGRWQFQPEYHFLYMLTHIAKHVVGSGAGIRMYLDVGAFVSRYREKLDWVWIREQLAVMGLQGFANTVLTLVEAAFGISSPLALEPMPGGSLEEFLEFTVAGGLFGREGQDSGTNALKHDSRDGSEVSRTGTLARRLFPSADTISSRYTYLQDKPWLLPVAWVHRVVKNREGWQEHTREAKNILAADKDEVRRLARMYRDIGL